MLKLFKGLLICSFLSALVSCLGCKFDGGSIPEREYSSILYINNQAAPNTTVKLTPLALNDKTWLVVIEQQSFLPLSKFKEYTEAEISNILNYLYYIPSNCGDVDIAPVNSLEINYGVEIRTKSGGSCLTSIEEDEYLIVHFENLYNDVLVNGFDNTIAQPFMEADSQ